MIDDLISGGILPSDDVLASTDFDPNAVDSDVFLDDPLDAPLGVAALDDEDDEMPDDE